MSDESIERLRGTALRYLGRRERTVAEVRERLRRDAAPPDQVATVLAELEAAGLLDDARYARLFAEDRRALDGWGRERIARTLLERGIERALVDEALAAEEPGGGRELDRALALLRRRFPQPPACRRECERALGVMVRKGFQTEVALDALLVYARS